MADRATQERIARNEATFRKANEQIEQAAEIHGLEHSIPFICECADATCTMLVRLSLDDYRRVRAAPRQFVVAQGHESLLNETALVEEHDGYVVVEKLEYAGEVAEELADG